MEKHDQLTRTCTSCGLQKPLSAFLQISPTQGTTYGAVCASCRSASMKEKAKAKPDDDFSGATSVERIGTKQKVEIDHKKQRELQQSKDNKLIEAKKQDKLVTDKFDRTQKIEEGEKTHRETYIDAKKKQGFLNYQSKKYPTTTDPNREKTAAQFVNSKERADKKQHVEKSSLLEEAVKQELRITSSDWLSGSSVDHLGNVASRDNAAFRAFINFLGTSAPITRMMGIVFNNALQAQKQIQQKTVSETATAQKSSGVFSHSQSTFSKTAQADNKGQKSDPVIDFINQTWRRR